MVQFGWGSRQRRIQAAEVDLTSAVSESIAQDKDLTKKLLHAAGVPVPLGRPVETLDEAWQAALEIGLPVVVKPQDGNQGKGVTVNIVSREHLAIAFRAAAEIGTVMVEKFLPGNDFRLLVVGRPDGGRGAARSAAGDRRRHVHRARADRPGECRPAARRRPCHLAHQDPARRHRDRAPGRAGPHARTRCPRRAAA